ncbi:MAG: hypothetical protein Q7U57_03260 [Methylovulum sp.]|nr:hypothetical protein [Methylovulum sp.]
MNNKTAKDSLFAVAKPLSVAIATLVLMQANPAIADTVVLKNTQPIVINDTCANPKKAECAALLDYYNPELPVTGEDGIRYLSPEVPVATASPYASIIDVPSSTFPKGARITDVNVYINNIHHGYLNDVDIMLVAPDGRWVMLASNVSAAGATEEGGVLGIKAKGLNWKFDDAAKLPLPRSVRDDGRLSNREFNSDGTPNPLYSVIYDEWVGVWTDTALRTFKPTDYDNSPDTDHFPDDVVPSTTSFNTSRNSVGLTPSTVLGPVTAEDQKTYKKVFNGPKLSNLNGISPTGQWRLVVVDDFYWFNGSIKGGWSLEITTK